MTEAQRKAKQKYRTSHKRFTIDFYKTEESLWQHLSGKDGKQSYIKNLIKKDMEGENTMDEPMTDFESKIILKLLVDMIENCKSLEEAKEKIEKLLEEAEENEEKDE